MKCLTGCLFALLALCLLAGDAEARRGRCHGRRHTRSVMTGSYAAPDSGHSCGPHGCR